MKIYLMRIGKGNERMSRNIKDMERKNAMEQCYKNLLRDYKKLGDEE